MSKEDIIAHVIQGRRETPNLPFYILDLLNIQRKYLKIVAEGWDNKPEKRIRMDEILLKFSDIEAELNNKSKKNNLESVGRSTRNPRKSISDNRRHSLQPPNSNSDSKRYSLQSPNSISDYRRYLLQPSNSISDYKQHSLQLKSKENLAPNLESVGEYTSYAMKSPADFDSFMINRETWKVEKT
ncbi:22629_t:CDS:1, partial [Gigaspora margarita]